MPTDARAFARMLGPISVAVFVGGWVLAIVAFFVIGTETCATTSIPLAGPIEVCQDTTSSAVILLTVIGFVATVGSFFLMGMRFMLMAMADIEQNTRKGG